MSCFLMIYYSFRQKGFFFSAIFLCQLSAYLWSNIFINIANVCDYKLRSRKIQGCEQFLLKFVTFYLVKNREMALATSHPRSDRNRTLWMWSLSLVHIVQFQSKSLGIPLSDILHNILLLNSIESWVWDWEETGYRLISKIIHQMNSGWWLGARSGWTMLRLSSSLPFRIA